MSTCLEHEPDSQSQEVCAPFSSGAVFSAVAASASVVVLDVPELILLPAIALIAGVVSCRSVRAYDLRGGVLAVYGIVASIFFGVVGLARPVMWYRAEALPGYARIEFDDLNETSHERWLGNDVCLKGYADWRVDLDGAVILTRNGNGNGPADRVLVLIRADESWDWQGGGLAVSGRLERNPEASTDLTAPRFVMRNAVIRASRTRYRIANAIPYC